jgi:hypothetical protein
MVGPNSESKSIVTLTKGVRKKGGIQDRKERVAFFNMDGTERRSRGKSREQNGEVGYDGVQVMIDPTNT